MAIVVVGDGGGLQSSWSLSKRWRAIVVDPQLCGHLHKRQVNAMQAQTNTMISNLGLTVPYRTVGVAYSIVSHSFCRRTRRATTTTSRPQNNTSPLFSSFPNAISAQFGAGKTFERAPCGRRGPGSLHPSTILPSRRRARHRNHHMSPFEIVYSTPASTGVFFSTGNGVRDRI